MCDICGIAYRQGRRGDRGPDSNGCHSADGIGTAVRLLDEHAQSRADHGRRLHALFILAIWAGGCA